MSSADIQCVCVVLNFGRVLLFMKLCQNSLEQIVMTKKKSILYVRAQMCFWTLGGNINVTFLVLCLPQFGIKQKRFLCIP